MPTLPLYSAAAVPDAWHQVTSPGGYEWWYFDAEDPRYDRQIAAILFQGFVFHPGYLRAWGRYARRPTRFAPPLPAEYPCAYFIVYESGRIIEQFMTQFAPSAFSASSDEPSVTVGPNRFGVRDGKLELNLSGTPWKLTGQGPKLLTDQTLSANLTFAPRVTHAPQERTFLSRQLSNAEHHWVIANPMCDVSGTIQLRGKDVEFRGRGYHDHNYGTAPLGPGLKRWFWGRVLLDDSVTTFHFARPRDRRLADEVHLVQADADGTREIPVKHVEADFSLRTKLLLTYPRRFALDDAIQLSNPRIIDPSPFYLRLTYDAICHGQRGLALCEVAYPHRLRWPVLGRMIEMSIDKRACAKD